MNPMRRDDACADQADDKPVRKANGSGPMSR